MLPQSGADRAPFAFISFSHLHAKHVESLGVRVFLDVFDESHDDAQFREGVDVSAGSATSSALFLFGRALRALLLLGCLDAWEERIVALNPVLTGAKGREISGLDGEAELFGD